MEARAKRTFWRWVRRALVAGLLAYALLHLADSLWYAWSDPYTPRYSGALEPGLLDAERAEIARALAEILQRDGVQGAEHWATAILKHSPTTDLGYIALVTAQIRRESRFLHADLEWLFDRVVPELAHELGLPDPVHTIGPMQIQRHTLAEVIAQDTGERLDEREVKQEAYSLEGGVHYCILYLDTIVREYIPERAIRGWWDMRGPAGLEPGGSANIAIDWGPAEDRSRRAVALYQKMLSDLTGQPLVLDGKPGRHTRARARSYALGLPVERRDELLAVLDEDLERWDQGDFGQRSSARSVRAEWEARHVLAPDGIAPRYTHDPRLVFVFADFNSGHGASRIAALQSMLNDLMGRSIEEDGKLGPITLELVREFLAASVADEARRADFLRLIDAGRKPRWVAREARLLAAALWTERFGRPAPEALCPSFAYERLSQKLKGIGRSSVREYVAGSGQFFESYYARLRRRLSGGETLE